VFPLNLILPGDAVFFEPGSDYPSRHAEATRSAPVVGDSPQDLPEDPFRAPKRRRTKALEILRKCPYNGVAPPVCPTLDPSPLPRERVVLIREGSRGSLSLSTGLGRKVVPGTFFSKAG